MRQLIAQCQDYDGQIGEMRLEAPQDMEEQQT